MGIIIKNKEHIFKIGDKVRIITIQQAKLRGLYSKYIERYFGKIAEILGVDDDGIYYIDADDKNNGWHEEYFENIDDMVNNPSHYTWLKEKCGIEVIDITRHFDFDLGNSLKYIMRAGHKRDSSITDKDKTIQDLEKAIFYLNDEINLIKNNYGN